MNISSPGAARAAWHDRNTGFARVSYEADINNNSALTTRWTYTCPADTKAIIMGAVCASCMSASGALPRTSRIKIDITNAPLAATTIARVRQESAVIGQVAVSNTSGALLLAADTLVATTNAEFTATETINFFAAAQLIELPA